MIWLCKAPPPQNKQRNQREFEKIKDLHQDYSKVVIARTRLQGKGEGISLTPYYHFHPLHRHVDISRAINAESSPLHIGSSRSRAGILWFPSASRSSSEKLICDKCKQTKLIWGGSTNIQPLDCRILGHQDVLTYLFGARKVFVFGVILVRMLPHSDWIWRDTPYLSLFSPNAGKCGPG